MELLFFILLGVFLVYSIRQGVGIHAGNQRIKKLKATNAAIEAKMLAGRLADIQRDLECGYIDAKQAKARRIALGEGKA